MNRAQTSTNVSGWPSPIDRLGVRANGARTKRYELKQTKKSQKIHTPRYNIHGIFLTGGARAPKNEKEKGNCEVFVRRYSARDEGCLPSEPGFVADVFNLRHGSLVYEGPPTHPPPKRYFHHRAIA